MLSQSSPAASTASTLSATRALATDASLEVPPKRKRRLLPGFSADEPLAQPVYQPQDPATAFLHLAGSLKGLDVLVIGPGALDTMCSLDEHDPHSVTAIRAGGRPPLEPADLVIVPRLECFECASSAIAQARVALRSLGRVVLCFTPDAADSLQRRVEMRLLESGFTVGRRRRLQGRFVMTADLPLFSSSHSRLHLSGLHQS